MEATLAAFIAKGTPSGWTLCGIALVGVIVLLKILAAQRPKMKEMEIDENAAIRAELREEMKALRDEARMLRDEVKVLRKENQELRGIIDGMRRDALTGTLSAQRTFVDSLPTETISEPMRRALDSLDNLPKGKP